MILCAKTTSKNKNNNHSVCVESFVLSRLDDRRRASGNEDEWPMAIRRLALAMAMAVGGWRLLTGW